MYHCRIATDQAKYHLVSHVAASACTCSRFPQPPQILLVFENPPELPRERYLARQLINIENNPGLGRISTPRPLITYLSIVHHKCDPGFMVSSEFSLIDRNKQTKILNDRTPLRWKHVQYMRTGCYASSLARLRLPVF